jgi:hypothetical protein
MNGHRAIGMIGMSGAIHFRRGEDGPQQAAWLISGGKFKKGAFTVDIVRGRHPDEPLLAEFGADHLTVERLKDGARLTLTLSAEDIARAQGPRRPEIDFLYYRLRHDGADIGGARFLITPPSSDVDAPRGVGARKGAIT